PTLIAVQFLRLASPPAARRRLDMRSDRRAAWGQPPPGGEAEPDTLADVDEVPQLPVELGRLVSQQLMHVRAGGPPALADHEDVLDLGEGRTEARRLLDEAKQLGRVVAVDAVAILRARRRRQDALPLVEADRLGRDSGPARQLADRESTVHVADSLNLSP